MITKQISKGQLLIAEPSIIGDISFNRSVILLADHTIEGSVGFILNKPLSYTINDLVPDVEADFKIFNGGPVEQDNLYFIHNVPDLIPNSIEISDGVFWGGDFNLTRKLINSNVITKNNINDGDQLLSLCQDRQWNTDWYSTYSENLYNYKQNRQLN